MHRIFPTEVQKKQGDDWGTSAMLLWVWDATVWMLPTKMSSMYLMSLHPSMILEDTLLQCFTQVSYT